MAVNGVSTYAVFQSTLTDVSKVENELNTEQQQLSSGDNAANFSDMPAQTQQYLSLSATLSRLNQYATDNQVIETRVNTASKTLGNIVTSLNNLQSLISQRQTGVASAGFGQQLTSYWQQIAGALNTSVAGQYLFSGTKTNVAPVSETNFPTTTELNASPTNYYSGNDQGITVRSDDSTSFVSNVNAGAPAFQQIYQGLALAQEGDASNDTGTLTQAYNLIQQGLQGVITLQATVNANASALSTSDTNNNNQKLYLTGIQQSIGNTDIVSVSTQVAINQGILQAAFQAFAKINSLRLSDYLK